MRKWLVILLMGVLAATFLAVGSAGAADNPMEAWKPKFDPSTAKYSVIVSNVSTPKLKGVYAGIAIRDELWARTNGQVFFDFRPFSQLGGEAEVYNLLQTGTIQGMASSSVFAASMTPGFGMVNLPYLLDSYERLDKFIANEDIKNHYMSMGQSLGLKGVNLTAYGQYGWASTTPIEKLEDMKKVKFRIAEAPVNLATYKAWGINPVVMPWPDVPVALKQGVITGLDHTDTVCFASGKFETCKFFTEIKYAQGLFLWLLNEKWFNDFQAKEPELAKTLIDVMNEKCNEMRAATPGEQATFHKLAVEKEGVKFLTLSDEEMNWLKDKAKGVQDDHAKDIGPEYLKQVQELLGVI